MRLTRRRFLRDLGVSLVALPFVRNLPTQQEETINELYDDGVVRRDADKQELVIDAEPRTFSTRVETIVKNNSDARHHR